jgi:hypothetical protein
MALTTKRHHTEKCLWAISSTKEGVSRSSLEEESDNSMKIEDARTLEH